MNYSIERSSEYQRIRAFLWEVDTRFFPQLSSRVDINAYSRKLAISGLNWFVISDGRDLAHAAMYANDLKWRQAFISSICVKEAHVRNGLGQALLIACVQHARSSGLTCIELDVSTANSSARRFYSLQGFVEAAELAGETLRMRLDL